MTVPLILGADSDSGALGGKAASLACLGKAGFDVPSWFAVPAPAGLSEDAVELPAETLAAVEDELAGEPDDALYAVRSSAVDEDGTGDSFAGQFESYLHVRRSDVPARIADVWRSGFGERVASYRAERGLPTTVTIPTAVVQLMVEPDTAGVAFSADPVSGERGVAVVSAVRGLGEALVSGEADADTFRVDAGGRILGRALAGDVPVLTDGEAIAVAALARAAEATYGVPQDVEWAYERGRLHVLQSRPITTLPTPRAAQGELNIWDNSNIAESYGGVTTPLTFSFAHRAYEAVYQELCRILGVPDKTIEANSLVFARMIGLIRGRVYYNLLSWYRLLAMLPGYRFNRRFMEQMMGVRESLPDELVAEQGRVTRGARIADGARLVRTMAGFVVNQFTLPRRIERFYARLDETLAPLPLDTMTADDLAAYYHHVEDRLLRRWDAPLVNDFFAMLYFGLLRSLCERWVGSADAMLQNDLISAEGGMISTEPGARMRAMAESAADYPELADALVHASGADLDAVIAAHPAFAEALTGYLARFGDRCLEELKLESATLDDDPLPLLRSVGHLAGRLRDGEKLPPPDDPTLRHAAEQRVGRALSRRPLRRVMFAWVLRNARARVRDRENLRFERTRVFGRARRVFLAFGREFVTAGALRDARDVFYLEVEEVLGFTDGTATTTDLADLVAVRRAEFDAYRAEPAPPDRFETRGAVDAQTRFIATGVAAPVTGDELTGIGCCAGRVQGRVRIVTDPREDTLERGEILVAERTDPGWVMIFPAAAGILVERGSLLSHSAIVAREMGIPAVVSLAGLTRWLSSGDLVEFDGTTGVVRRLEHAEAAHDG